MRAGKLNKRVTFQTITETLDAAGGIVETWATAFTRWANVAPANGGEGFRYDQDLETVAGKITLRHDAKTKLIDGTYRAQFDGRVFEILSAINVDEAGKTVTLNYRHVK